MKSMLSLDLEGRQIKLYPGDTVSKWGEITHATIEGVLVLILKVVCRAFLAPLPTDRWQLGAAAAATTAATVALLAASIKIISL